MSEQEKQENQKTIVAFAAGLLIGGLLVWVFGGSPKTEEVKQDTENKEVSGEVEKTPEVATSAVKENAEIKPVLETGEGKIELKDQQAGNKVILDSAVFPSDEGWVGVRDYVNGQSAGLLGVARYSKEQGLIPEEVILQRSTQAGKTYSVVFYKESGDRVFSLAQDTQIEGTTAVFTAK